MRKSTKLWKVIYKKIDDVFDEEYKEEVSAKKKEMKETGKKVEEKKEEEKKVEEEKKLEEEKKDEEENNEEKEEEKGTDEKQEQSVQDTQLSPPSPPHATITPTESIKIKDVTDNSCQNINPLTTEDLTKILDQSTQVARLCSSPILVSVDELQKLVEKSNHFK